MLKGTEYKTSDIQLVEVGAIGDRMVEAVSGISVGDPLLTPQLLAEVSK